MIEVPRQDILVNELQADLFGYLQPRIGLKQGADSHAIGRIVNGQIVGAVGYDGFNGSTCHMHIALTEPWALNRALLWKMFEVPFIQWDLPVVLAATGSQNRDCLKLINGLGFEHCVTIDQAHDDGALEVFKLYKKDCRWLNIRYYDNGKVSRTGAEFAGHEHADQLGPDQCRDRHE